MSVEPPAGSYGRPANPSRDADTRTVLLAEDEEGVREFVRQVLEQAGYAVVCAPNGRDAGDLFAATPDRFDLLLTDVLMPHGTGPELAARARKVRPGLPVVFMSAYTGTTPVSADTPPPGERLIEKPFGIAQLLHVVATALGDDQPD
jgi:DNA-binding NtrC family response regulator